MDFWTAYSEFRKLVTRPEEIAVGAEVSIHSVIRWDLRARDPGNANGRNPSYFNRVRLARLAEEKGAARRVIAALKPDAKVPGAQP